MNPPQKEFSFLRPNASLPELYLAGVQALLSLIGALLLSSSLPW